MCWPGRTGGDDDPFADLVLAAVDECGPTAAEHTASHLRVFFASDRDRDAALVLLRHAWPSCDAQKVDVPDERWAERSQAALTAITIGALTIAPPWAIPPDRDVIVIEPSMGFGTGHHASTRLCLRLLQEQPISGARVLDAGTGSGVLAIAALKLGAASVTAIDNDADAVASARVSAGLNAVAASMDIRQADLERDPALPGEPFSLILANLTGGMLIRLAERLCTLAVPDGSLIVSGVLATEEDAVTAAFSRCGALPTGRLADDEWVGLRLRAPGSGRDEKKTSGIFF